MDDYASKIKAQAIPWWSSGQDSVLPLQGTWVQSLVRELRSYTARSMAKKNESTIIHPEATRCFLRHFSDVSSAGLWESSGLVMNANFIFTQMCRYIE